MKNINKKETYKLNCPFIIKQFRRVKGLTQEQASEIFNVKRPTLASWETGKNQPPNEIIIFIFTELAIINKKTLETMCFYID